MAKFFFFEKIVQLFYTHVFTEPKDTYSKPTQLGVTFASGYLAGVVCAIVSHPADSLVSLLGKAENKGKSVGQITSEVGFGTLATKGLGTRVLMIGAFNPLLFHVPMFIFRFRYPHWLPMVDLRFVQGRDGYGDDRWQVINVRLFFFATNVRLTDPVIDCHAGPACILVYLFDLVPPFVHIRMTLDWNNTFRSPLLCVQR